MTGLFWLILGLVFVVKGANWLVDGASSLARRLGVSDLAIGLTVVAFGTSLPEMTVNIFAAIQNQPAIAIGDVAGSNICNILLVLGTAAFLYPLQIQKSTAWKEIPFCFLAAVMLLALTHDKGLDGAATNILSRTDGLCLLALFLMFMVYISGMARQVLETEGHDEEFRIPIGKTILFIVLGLILLTAGGKLVVQGAIQIADMLGISKSFVAVTLVAMGTSVPELAASIVSAFRKKANIAVGNIIGSNVFNVFLILGTSSVIRPKPVPQDLNLGIYMGVVAVAVFFILLLLGKRYTLNRWKGAVMLALYVAYLFIQPR
jgi:cation:H+ antiporter